MKTKPNILVFMTDQQRGDTISNKDIILPNIRRLASSGLTFNNAFCPSPHCCPSRATFFTGLYPTQHGVWNNVCVQNRLSKGLNDGIDLFSQFLEQEKYDLFYAGKWHVCYESGPEDYGFEELHVTCNKESKNDPTSHNMAPGWQMYAGLKDDDTKLRKRGEILRPGYPDYIHYGIHENPFQDADIVESAIAKLRTLRRTPTQPWMMFIGTLGPHDPYFVPQRFLDMYADYEVELSDIHVDSMEDKPAYNRRIKGIFDQLTLQEKKEAIKHYMAFCTYEDYLFGKVINELEEHEDFDNTIILFTSDHGDYNGEHGLWCKGLPAFRSAYHIPAVFYWGKGIENPGRTVDDLVSLADFSETFLDFAGAKFNENTVGKSLSKYFHSENNQTNHEFIFTQTNGNEIYGIQRSVFNHYWKLVYNSYDFDELYDLKNDPEELSNLINDESLKYVRKSLYKKLWQFALDVNDQCLNPYIMVGMAEFGPATAFEK